MEIAGKQIKPPVAIAPMAGVTDYPYRQILREMGAELIYTEMVSSKGLVYGSKKTEELLDYRIKNDGYINIQIFGEEAEFIVEASQKIEEKYKPDFIDLNMGCPAPKIVKNGAGAALMKTPSLVREIVTAMVENLHTPVTVKIRAGWDEKNINGAEIAQIVEKAGAQAVAVHGRTRKQFYAGQVDYDVIKQVKEAVNIPVIGNGDIFDLESAEKMFRKTNCDGIMVARGIQGNPWLIKRLKKYFEEGLKNSEPTPQKKIKMALYHLEKAVDYYGEKVAIPKMRKHISWYIKGLKNSTYVKDEINKLKEKEAVITTLKKYKKTFN